MSASEWGDEGQVFLPSQVAAKVSGKREGGYLVDVWENDVGLLLDEVFEYLVLPLQCRSVAVVFQAAGIPHVVHPQGRPRPLSFIYLHRTEGCGQSGCMPAATVVHSLGEASLQEYQTDEA